VLTAGAAIVFWLAAPFLLLRQGKDVTVNKGVTLDVYTDRNHELAQAPAPKAPAKTLLAANTAEATVLSMPTNRERRWKWTARSSAAHR
jgi:hypothetical protein